MAFEFVKSSTTWGPSYRLPINIHCVFKMVISERIIWSSNEITQQNITTNSWYDSIAQDHELQIFTRWLAETRLRIGRYSVY